MSPDPHAGSERETLKPAKPAKPWPAFYAEAWPGIVGAARRVGYAVALHGSMGRDLDVIAVPWTDAAGSPEDLVAEIGEWIQVLAPEEVGQPQDRWPRAKPHGRLAWSLHLGGGAYIDLSIMPRALLAAPSPSDERAEPREAALIAEVAEAIKYVAEKVRNQGATVLGWGAIPQVLTDHDTAGRLDAVSRPSPIGALQEGGERAATLEQAAQVLDARADALAAAGLDAAWTVRRCAAMVRALAPASPSEREEQFRRELVDGIRSLHPAPLVQPEPQPEEQG
jgi:hypothetical protein